MSLKNADSYPPTADYDLLLLNNQIDAFIASFRKANTNVGSAFGITCTAREVTPVNNEAIVQAVLEQYEKLKTNALTEEQIDSLKHITQHLSSGAANSAWLRAREMRVTSSVVGSASGLGKYGSPATALKDYVFARSFFGNAATNYGNLHEDDAESAFKEFWKKRLFTKIVESDNRILVNFSIAHFGLCVDKTTQYLAGSPDGFLTLFFNNGTKECRLIEYKCPYSKRNYVGEDTMYPRQRIKCTDALLCVPANYFCQVHHLMQILGVQRTEFVVWAPYIVSEPSAQSTTVGSDAYHFHASNGTIERTLIDFDVGFYAEMKTRVDHFFKYYLMVALVLKKRGLLLSSQMKMRDDLFKKTWSVRFKNAASSSSSNSDTDSVSEEGPAGK